MDSFDDKEVTMIRTMLALVCMGPFSTLPVDAQIDRPPLTDQDRRPLAETEPDAAFQAALIAAVHHFARVGDVENLAGILQKHPKLAEARQQFPEPRKPEHGDGFRPLHWAAESGQSDAVRYLLGRGVNPNADGGCGWTPLHLAARAGHLSVVKELVKGGAKVDAKTEAVPERFAPSGPALAQPLKLPAIPSATALEVAQQAGHLDVAEYLKSVGK